MPVTLPVIGLATDSLVDLDTGDAFTQSIMIVIVDTHPVVEYSQLDLDARNRIDDLQAPFVKNIDDAGTNEWKRYKNITNPKLPDGGDYQEIYVKDGDTNKRLVYD